MQSSFVLLMTMRWAILSLTSFGIIFCSRISGVLSRNGALHRIPHPTEKDCARKILERYEWIRYS